MVAGVLFFLFTPNVILLKKLNSFAVQMMLLYLFAGMFFLLYDQTRLIIISLACCGVLTLYLKGASNQNMRLPEVTSEPNISIALINLSLGEGSYQETINKMVNTNADVLCLQELTPDWSRELAMYLSQEYPYNGSLVQLDPFGAAVYSKYQIDCIDTFYYQNIPNLRASVKRDEDHIVHVISSHILPAVNRNALRRMGEHFHSIAHYTDSLQGAIVTVGDFNLVPWSVELQEFRYLAGLEDGRRDVNQRSLEGSLSFFNIPYDHIFHSSHLECTEFNEITNQSETHLGIFGTYQYKKSGSSL